MLLADGGDVGGANVGVGPAYDALAALDGAVNGLLSLLHADDLPPVDLTDVAERLHIVDTRIRALHAAFLARAIAGDALPTWAPTAASWVRNSHRLDGARAAGVVRNARWLAESDHELTRAAFEAGEITADHVTAMRVVASASKARKETFLAMQSHLVEVARNADPARTAQVLKCWADAVDAADGDADAEASWGKRGFHLSAVGDGWDIRGYLPATEGAELSGILTAFIERARHASTDEPITPAQRRADGLMDLARAGSRADLARGARDRAKVTVLVPVHRLHTCAECGGHHHVPGQPCDGPGHALWRGSSEHQAASWSVGNGPGGGFLAHSDALRLTCDGEISRLVVGPDSRPLDIGRTTRVVPAHLRRAIEVRDGGCVIPGCDRPAGWCEAHHVRHWAEGGVTAAENLALLCSRHHHELHQGEWQIRFDSTGGPQAQRRRHRPHERRCAGRKADADVADPAPT